MLLALPGAFAIARGSGTLGDRRGQAWALLAGAALFADLALWHLAMLRTTAANATLLVSGLSPIWVALLSVLGLHLRYRWFGWVGQGFGLGGALILGVARGAHGGNGSGELIALGASFCYAAFTLAMSRARLALDAGQCLFWMSAGCFACFAVAVGVGQQPLAGYTAAAWWSLVGLALVVQLGAWWASTWGLGHVNAAVGALALQGQQVATLFLAAWWLGEPVTLLGLLGAALLIGGILLVAWSSPRRARIAAEVPPSA
jgi:drug/metabolite transporter (DMT)-like permease